MAGGENNAYTSNDVTNYYIQLPAENLETAFWLESDRMLSLGFSEKKASKCSVKWLLKNLKSTTSTNPTVMYGLSCAK